MSVSEDVKKNIEVVKVVEGKDRLPSLSGFTRTEGTLCVSFHLLRASSSF